MTPSGEVTGSRLTPYYQILTINRGQEPQIGVQSGSAVSTVCIGKNFTKTQVGEHPSFIEVDHIFGPVIQIWKDLGTMSFWSCDQSFSGRVFFKKVVVVNWILL